MDRIDLGNGGWLGGSPSVEETPLMELVEWQVIEFRGFRNLVGYNIPTRAGRVSSGIKEWDPSTRTATTNSGRQYQLVGPAKMNNDAQFVLSHWLAAQGGKRKEVVTVTDEYLNDTE
jgi:hypothetical protein